MSLREARKDTVEGEEVVHVACSICLDSVNTAGDRSTARLQCGHEFHLDCIGSAFNAKGSMQCPNCRKVEEGIWLYANGSRPTPEFTVDEWTQDEDLYNLSYPETPYECFWSPFGGSIARIPSLFEEGESSPAVTFRDLLGHPAIFTEPQAAVSATHPLLAYTRVFQPPSSSGHSFEARINGPGYQPQWSHLQRPRDIHIPHIIAPSNLHYPGWEHHLSYPLPDAHIGCADPASQFPRFDSDGLPTADSVFRPFALSHGIGPRAGATSSSMPTLVAAPYNRNPGAIAHEHYQLQISQSAHGACMPLPLPQASLRSFNQAGQCSTFLILPTTPSGQANAEAESLQSGRVYSREPTCWGHFVPGGGAPPDNNSPPGFFPSNVSERPPAQAAGYSSNRPVPLVRMLSLM